MMLFWGIEKAGIAQSLTDPLTFTAWHTFNMSLVSPILFFSLCAAVPVMVFSGESDFVCNSLSSEQWLDGLIWSKQRAWKT
jgi:carboxypeptidase C (cathepsin A)